MSGNENIILKLHKVYPEYVYSSVQFEIDIHTNRIISQESLSVSDNNLIERIDWEDYLEEQPKLCLKHIINEDLDEPTITLIKFEGDKTTETHINETINRSSEEPYIFDSSIKKQNIQLKLPDAAIISCQNCDTAFPTKYQYQRHQCEFNASKVVLKPEIVGKDIDKATRLRFECDTCKKTFVSNNNLERHRNCHMNIKSNVCEHCKKTFVSENRLKIHKENHCKKAGDTTKFYRSDVVVWHCENCKQVFATQQCGEKHISDCAVIQQETKTELESNESISTEDKSETKNDSVNMTNDNNVDSKSEIVNQIESENKNQQNNTDKSTEIPKLSKVVTEILYQCEFCNQTFITKSTLLSHQGSHTTEKNYECTFCEKYFNSYTVAVTHWQNKCTEESNLFYLPKMIYCEHCDRGFKSHELLYSHKNKKKHFTPKIHEKKINENISSTNENAIVKLIENMITKMDKMVTEGNDETENKNEENKENDENGKKKRGRRRKWEKMDLKNKKRSDMIDGYMYQCERCSVVFKDISALEAHKNTQHVSIYSCGQCGQVVHSSKALVIHSRAHQSLKPYVCDQCGRSYSQTSHLWQHMRFHQGIKPFACPHEGCEARYTIRPDLKDHIRKVHTRERPFKCSVCQKCFLTGSVYYQHRLIHTNDRRYGCEVCHKRFFRADALNNHRRIHTDERPYPCPVCGREFRQKGDRNKHLRTQHPM